MKKGVWRESGAQGRTNMVNLHIQLGKPIVEKRFPRKIHMMKNTKYRENKHVNKQKHRFATCVFPTQIGA
jgi:hypothetical protein